MQTESDITACVSDYTDHSNSFRMQNRIHQKGLAHLMESVQWCIMA